MAVGSLVHNEFASFVDPSTGARLERLTSPKVTCHLPKHTCRYISADGSLLLYVGEYGETRQLYAMNLMTDTSVQLTGGRGLCEYGGIWLDVDDAHVLVLQGDELSRIDLETLLRERVYTCAPGWLPQCFTLSEDGRYVVLTEYEHTSVPVSVEESDWSYFALTTIASPHCRIVLLDRQTNECHVVRDEHCWLGLATLRPGDPTTILYCHEGPYDYIDDRMWLVNSDGTNVRCVRETSEGAIVVGESWAKDGSGLYYEYLDEETVKDGATSGQGARICVTDFETLESREVTRCHFYAHASGSRDHRWIVGDASNGVPLHLLSDAAPAAPAEVDDYLYLMGVGAWRELRLCHHGTSWGHQWGTIQDTHPHPAFSSDNRWVLFNSDRDGHPAIYRVDLVRFLWERGRVHGPFEPGEQGLPDAAWGFPATFAS